MQRLLKINVTFFILLSLLGTVQGSKKSNELLFSAFNEKISEESLSLCDEFIEDFVPPYVFEWDETGGGNICNGKYKLTIKKKFEYDPFIDDNFKLPDFTLQGFEKNDLAFISLGESSPTESLKKEIEKFTPIKNAPFDFTSQDDEDSSTSSEKKEERLPILTPGSSDGKSESTGDRQILDDATCKAENPALYFFSFNFPGAENIYQNQVAERDDNDHTTDSSFSSDSDSTVSSDISDEEEIEIRNLCKAFRKMKIYKKTKRKDRNQKVKRSKKRKKRAKKNRRQKLQKMIKQDIDEEFYF